MLHILTPLTSHSLSEKRAPSLVSQLLVSVKNALFQGVSTAKLSIAQTTIFAEFAIQHIMSEPFHKSALLITS